MVTGDTVNNLNQLKTRQGGSGVLPIRGTTNEPSSVTVNGKAATVKADNSFEGKANVVAGNNTVTVSATDTNGNTTTNRYNVLITGSGSKTLVYDPNGNLTSDGTRTFEWDPLNRLTAVTAGSHRSEFTYSGLGQRVKIVEKDNGSVSGTKNLISVGSEICEERDAANNVTKRYYPQGFTLNSQQSTTNYFYTRDHLGSVREVTDTSGLVQARYDYDPYGRRTKVTGTLEADFRFTGHYYHQPSGLHLAFFRAYDADLGRWISRDPIEEQGGINLYGYCWNDPTRWTDRFGLDIWIEGNSGSEGGGTLHQSVNVGDPLGNYDSYSFGWNGHGLEGEVYRDTSHGGPIEAYKKTTDEEDEEFRKKMENEVRKKGTYGISDTCRSYSQRKFGEAPGQESAAPNRPPTPPAPGSQGSLPSSTQSSSTTTSTTDTSTSR